MRDLKDIVIDLTTTLMTLSKASSIYMEAYVQEIAFNEGLRVRALGETPIGSIATRKLQKYHLATVAARSEVYAAEAKVAELLAEIAQMAPA